MDELLDRAVSMRARGEPFVMATVVWSSGLSSGKQGSRAIISADGRMEGWLGGACAAPTLVRTAREVLSEGRARLVVLGPDHGLAGGDREGVRTVPMACDSEGTMEVYLEPVFPPPHLVVVGNSPAAGALTAMARALGWRTSVVDDGGRRDDHHPDDRVFLTLDLDEVGVDRQTMVVVATQGHYDEEALSAALATGARYVGLVASRKRSGAVEEYLRERGIGEADLARVRAPAGLDLGRVGHREMAVSILAELVALRSVTPRVSESADAGAASAPAEGSRVGSSEVTDPVCGMMVITSQARFRVEHRGRRYWFCAAGCETSFRRDPDRYASAGE
ncbi:MAG: XdhC family protein [bacterium]|nr:XdhC family protein [bacterium]